MKQKFNLSYEHDDVEYEIEVTAEYRIENTGIGPYEFWGQKCFDEGTDSIKIENYNFDKSGIDEDQIASILAAIEQSEENWEMEISENNSAFDY